MGTIACTFGILKRESLVTKRKERKKETASLNNDVTYLFFFLIMIPVSIWNACWPSMEYFELFRFSVYENRI